MNKYIFGFLVMLVSGHVLADSVDSLQDMSKESGKIRELTIECYVELKMAKSKGWKSEECVAYKQFSKNELQEFRKSIKKNTEEFRKESKSKDLSKRRIKRGLKKLVIIQSNMENVGTINKKIKGLAKS